MRRRFWFAALLLAGTSCASATPAPTPDRSNPAAPRSPNPGTSASAAATASPTLGNHPPPAPRVGGIGTPHPVIFAASAPDGRWLAFCQAREDTDANGKITVRVGPGGKLVGDRLQQYLVVGEGQEQPLQGLLAEDPAGRWLVVRHDDRVWLLDTRTGSSTDLTSAGFDDRADRLAYAPHRALSFDGSGTRLAYLRRQQGKTRVVVRSLESGTETLVDPGPGAVWRVDLDSSGEWVILRVLVQDTNGNGRLNWPVPKSPADPPRCTGPVPHFDAWVDRGDQPIVRVASSRGGRARTEGGFVAPFGKSLLIREPGGRLLLRLPNRTSKQMADAKCGARVMHADPTRGLVLAACGAAEGRPPLMLLSLAKNVSLDQEVAPQSHDHWPGATPRLVAVYPGAGALLVDMDLRRTIPLSQGDAVIATKGSRALVRRGGSLHLFDAATGKRQTLAGTTDLHPHLVRADPIAMVSPLVVDVSQGKLLGRVDQRPLAVTASGSVLVALGGDATADRLATGPLRWVSPSPVLSGSKRR